AVGAWPGGGGAGAGAVGGGDGGGSRGGGGGRGFFCCAMKGAFRAGRKIAAARRCRTRTACRPIAPLEGPGRGPFRHGSNHRVPMRSTVPRARLAVILPTRAGQIELRNRGTSSGASCTRKAARR